MARGVDRAHAHAAELELPAVVEGLVLVVGLRSAVHVDRRAGRRGEPAVPGDVVGVVVRLEDVLDVHAEVAGELEVLVDLELRVDDGRDPASSSPTRYDAQPRSSWVIWRKIIAGGSLSVG